METWWGSPRNPRRRACVPSSSATCARSRPAAPAPSPPRPRPHPPGAAAISPARAARRGPSLVIGRLKETRGRAGGRTGIGRVRVERMGMARRSGGCGEILSSRSRRRGPDDGRIVGGAAGVGRSWGRHPARRIASLGGFRLPLTHRGGERRRRRPAGHGTTQTQQMNETMEE